MGVAESQINLLTPLQGSRLFRERAHRLELDGQKGYFTNNTVLPEHDAMIRSHREIFAAFYYFELEHLTRKELIEAETLAHMLAESYRRDRIADHTVTSAKAV